VLEADTASGGRRRVLSQTSTPPQPDGLAPLIRELEARRRRAAIAALRQRVPEGTLCIHTTVRVRPLAFACEAPSRLLLP
jgi:hypothetical protein